MRIEFEEYYGSTPFICRNCFLDCSECPYDADIFTLARVDELLLKSDCGSKRSGGQKRIWRKLNSNLKRSARDKGFEPLTFWSVAAAEYKSARFPVLFSPLLPGKCGAFSTVTVCKTRASTARMGQCLGQESVFHNIPHVKFT